MKVISPRLLFPTKLLDACTGLRVGELLALKWSDVNNLQLHVTHLIVHQVVGNCKTEASQKPVPLDSFLPQELLTWRRQSSYNQEDDWVFASPLTKGLQPYWPENLMKRGIRPAAKKDGITKHVSWYTFRRTYSTLLKANGDDVKTVQELLRHANSRITLDIYTQAVTPAKRDAQTKIVRMIVAGAGPMEAERERCRKTTKPFRTYVRGGAICKCLKKWRGRRDSNSRPLP